MIEKTEKGAFKTLNPYSDAFCNHCRTVISGNKYWHLQKCEAYQKIKSEKEEK